jgi:hypothetical protein
MDEGWLGSSKKRSGWLGSWEKQATEGKELLPSHQFQYLLSFLDMDDLFSCSQVARNFVHIVNGVEAVDSSTHTLSNTDMHVFVFFHAVAVSHV